MEHNLLTYAAAIAFQALVACVPLSLFGLGLLGALGLDNVWSDSLAPALHGRVTPAVYHAIDDTARRVLHSGSAGVIAFSALLSTWYLAAAMRAVMEALNAIHDMHDPRPWWRRALLAVALGIGCGAALIGSILIVTAAPRVGGGIDAVADVGRWLVALVLLMTAVALLVRFAPAEHPQPRWASAGSILVVCSWIVASLVFPLARRRRELQEPDREPDRPAHGHRLPVRLVHGLPRRRAARRDAPPGDRRTRPRPAGSRAPGLT